MSLNLPCKLGTQRRVQSSPIHFPYLLDTIRQSTIEAQAQIKKCTSSSRNLSKLGYLALIYQLVIVKSSMNSSKNKISSISTGESIKSKTLLKEQASS